MSKQTKQTQSELLSTQTSAGEDQPKEGSSSELVERNEIPNTPFHIVGNKEQGYFLTMGRFRLMDNSYSTEEELFEMVDKEQWNLIFNMIVTVCNAVEDYKNETLKTQQ